MTRSVFKTKQPLSISSIGAGGDRADLILFHSDGALVPSTDLDCFKNRDQDNNSLIYYRIMGGDWESIRYFLSN